MRLLLVTAALAGCSFSPAHDPASFACSAEAPECPPGTTCIEGRCRVPADAGPPPDLRFRQELRLALPIEGDLNEVPVLVTLTPDVFDYASARADGNDIRFTDDAGNGLVHEVEEWNPGGRSIVWVKLARLGAGDQSIWLYYGDPDADPPTGAREVWSRYQAVYHLGAGGGDSAAAMNDGALTGTESAAGQVGAGRQFRGDDHIEIGPDPPLLRAVPGATLEAWVQPGSVSGAADQVVVAVSAHGATLSRAQIKLDPTGNAKVVFRTVDVNDPNVGLIDDRPLVAGEWTWMVAVADFPAGTVRIYLDGVATAAVTAMSSFADATPDTAPDRALIGIDETDAESFAGLLDEVRIAGTAMSAPWIRTQYLSMTGQLVSFEPPEAL